MSDTLSEFIHPVSASLNASADEAFFLSLHDDDMDPDDIHPSPITQREVNDQPEITSAKLGVIVAVVDCLDHLIQKSYYRASNIVFNLSPGSIVFSVPKPTPEELVSGTGVYLALSLPSFSEPSPRYICPELETVNETSIIGLTMQQLDKCASFTLGLILAEALTGEILFGDETDEDAHQRIRANERPDLSRISSTHLVRVISRCLSSDPQKRPSLQQLAQQIRRYVNHHT